MTTTIASNGTQDLFLGADGNIPIRRDIDAVAQNCRTAMLAQRAEMIYHVNAGMPTRATAFNRLNAPQFEAAARSILTSVDGVNSVLSFEVTQTDDRVIYIANIETIYGIVAVTNGL